MYSMGLDTELEFDKYCKVVRNPKVGRRSQYHGSKSAAKVEKRIPTSRLAYTLKSVDDESTEISFGKSRSSSHKSMAHGSAGISNNRVLQRDPICKGSEEYTNTRKMGEFEERKKIELSCNGDASLSFRVFDALSLSDMASPLVDQRISSLISSSVNEIPSPAFKTYIEPETPDLLDLSFRFPSTQNSITGRNLSSDELFSISTESEDGDQMSVGKVERDSMGPLKLQRCQTVEPLNEGNGLLGRNRFLALHKSSSVNVRMPNSPCQSESNHPSQKTRFSPFRRMLDPIMKSKSMRSSPVSAAALGDVTTSGLENIRKNGILHKSLRNAFSNVSNKKESDFQLSKDLHSLVMVSPPGHLNGLLTVGVKHGVPYFEFSVSDQEELLSAKTWKANNTCNWVYTFHSMNKRVNNNSRWGSKERCKEPAMVGQMQVSCFLLSEMRNSGVFDCSTVTEFVLYDIMNARRNMAAQDSTYCPTELVEPTKGNAEESLVSRSSQLELNFMNQKLRNKDTPCNDESDASTHYPWSPADLHPNSEIAAIVIQIPLEKRESLKEKPAQKLGDKHQSVLDLYAVDNKIIRQANVKVVTPIGTHGLPIGEEGGSPSSLLDRWRSGGRCDCGAWDMACPLVVFDSLTVHNKAEDQFMDVERPIKIFFEGGKDKVPALTMTSISGGQYSVDFHAQLSKLQAFSICVAILHSSEASIACGLESEQESLHCNSLKMLLNEEVRLLIGAVGEKER